MTSVAQARALNFAERELLLMAGSMVPARPVRSGEPSAARIAGWHSSVRKMRQRWAERRGISQPRKETT